MEASLNCFIEDSVFSELEWCEFFIDEGMDVLRLGLSGLAGSEGCLNGEVCMAFGLEPAQEHDDEWLDYVETRKISKAFNFAVEQSMHCYIDGSAASATPWC